MTAVALVAAGVLSWGLAAGGGTHRSATSRAARTDIRDNQGSPAGGVAPTTASTLPPPADPSAPARIITPGLDLPNPFVLVDGGTYYLYSSQYSFYKPNIPVRSAATLGSWSPESDALPVLPSWGRQGFTWAPDVRKVGGRYVMYYTEWIEPGEPITKCIGVAVGDRPLGPFTPVGQPLVCQLDHHGSIDPRSFVDANGQLWLDWKSDDNADVNGTTHSSIYAQRLSADGTQLLGAPVVILTADQPWEGRIVEAPQMVLANGGYWLFYSANWFNQPAYGIGYAECSGPAGPCHKPLDHAWLGSNAQGSGPGEESLFEDGNGWWIVYGPLAVRYRTDTKRPVALAHVAFGPEGPYLAAF